MKDETKRKHSIQVRLSDEEYEAFNRKFNASGMKSRSDFFRKMIFQGYIVQFNEKELKDLLKLARNISNNINQIAVRANSGGGVYADDIAEIRKGVDQLWQTQIPSEVSQAESICRGAEKAQWNGSEEVPQEQRI